MNLHNLCFFFSHSDILQVISGKETKLKGIPSGGYLIGRHPECGACNPLCLLGMIF